MASNTYHNSYTQSEIAYSALEPTAPAICIPRVFSNITERRIKAIFDRLNLGEVCRIDMVSRKNNMGEEFYRVFVHLCWGDSEDANRTRETISMPGGEVKVVYDEPWFWKLRASTSPGRREPSSKRRRPFPYIQSMTASVPSAEVPENEGRKHVAVKAVEELSSVLQSDIVSARD